MSDIELPKPDHWSQMLDEPERAYYTADQLRAAILADREKRAQAAQRPMTQAEHEVMRKAQLSSGIVVHAGKLATKQAEAPTASNEREIKQGASHEKESCDGQINPSAQSHGGPDSGRACTDGRAGEDQCDQHRAGNAAPQREDDQRARQCDGLRGACDFSAQEPYGQVTTHSVTGQQFFYRWPQPPYLDNASECVTVYAALATQQEAQPQAERETVDKKINKRHALNLIQELIKAERDDAYDEGYAAARGAQQATDKKGGA